MARVTAAPSTTIGALFDDAVRRYSDREALVDGERTWTYAQLQRAAYALAASLPALGTPARIGIVGANHPAYVMAYLAAHACGAATVELSRDESIETLRHALTTAGVRVVFTDRDDLAAALPHDIRVCAFDAVFDLAAGAPGATAAIRAAEPDDEAAVIFTSGTTGTPKGVVLTQRNLTFVNDAVCRYLELTAGDRYGIALPLCHTYGKSTLLSALSSGATAILLPRLQNVSAFATALGNHRCSILSVVPFHLAVMLKRAGNTPSLASLRAVTTSGGALSEATAAAWSAHVPHARLFSMYGLSEAATRVTYLDPRQIGEKPRSVGRALPGVHLQIQDAGRTLGPGEVGEIVVAGPNVMRGYLNDDELTARTIVDGALRTGDLGRLDADVCLYIEGRSKEIIKIAGERVSPAEIEDLLIAHPDVADAAVVGRPDPLLGETIVAFVAAAPERVPALASYCARTLAPHKLPRQFHAVRSIPRTSTGKVRRHLLPG